MAFIANVAARSGGTGLAWSDRGEKAPIRQAWDAMLAAAPTPPALSSARLAQPASDATPAQPVSAAKQRFNYLSPPQLHTLRQAMQPINEAFDDVAYLVGSVLTRPDYRDVDVRFIFDDDRFRHFFGPELDQHHGHATALWTSLAVTYSRELSRQTGLNVDFQFQARSVANDGSDRHAGTRDALMVSARFGDSQ